jgi:hypothetical protein
MIHVLHCMGTEVLVHFKMFFLAFLYTSCMPIECKVILPLPAAHDEMGASFNVCCHYGFFFYI